MPNTPHHALKSEAPISLHSVGSDEYIAPLTQITSANAESGTTSDTAVSEASKPPFYWFTTHLNLPYLVLAALLVATGVAAWRTYNQEKQVASAEFTRAATDTAGRVKSAIDDVERVMRGASGLIAANPELTNKQWLIYLQSLDQTLRVPGLNEIGFWRADLADNKVKALTENAKLAPSSNRSSNKSLPNLAYAVAPNSNILPLGYEWKLDPRIAAAVSEAQNLQAFAISAPLEWAPRVPQYATAVLMVMPVYTNPRDSILSQQEKSLPIGFVHAVVRIDELLASVISEGSAPLNISLADGETPIFSTSQMRSAVSASNIQAHRFDTSMSRYGRPWRLSIAGSVRELDTEVNRLPILIGLSGIIGTALIAGLIFLLSRLRKQAQGLAATMTVQLRNQVKLTEDLIEMNPVPIYRKDAHGRYISFNRAWEKMTGFDRADYIGRTVNEVQSEEQAFATERVEMELLQNPGLINTEEQRFLIQNGTLLDVIVSKTAIFDTDGKPAGMVGTVTDVSQIKKLEAELREQNKFTADLIEFNPTPIFRKDAAGRWVAVNAAWERFTGRHRSEALGKTNREYQRPEVADQNDAADRQLLQSPSGYTTGNIRLKNVQGEVFETIVARALIRRTDGTIDGMIGTITDITPMFKLEQMLSAQREQLDLVIRSSQQGIWDIRYAPNTGSQPAPYFSDRFYNILGYSSTDNSTAPISFEQIIHPDDFAQFEDARLAHFAGKTRFFDAECRAQTKSGQFVWLRTRGIAQSEASKDNKKDNDAANAQTVRFTGSIIDITTNKNAEVELFEANIRVTESAKAKESFLATMSHEIRTPLNGVLGMANLLSETSLTDEQQDYIRVIRASGDTLLGLIDDILDFTKIESGRMALENQPLDLIGVIESAMDMVQEKAREKKLYLLFSIADEVPNYVMGDITRLRQVLINLLSNAVKFTPAGQISVSVEINAVASPRFELIIRVADTGIGIPENRINKLFQPFTQVDETTTRRFGGTGLGLAISKRICELMGGNVSATSVEGQGSVFTVKIVTQSARGPLQPHMLRNISEFEDKSVLLIGGYLPYQESLALLLQRWGLRTTIALNEDAMAHLNPRQHFDVVLAELDLDRPFNAPLCIALDNTREDCEIKHGHTLPVILHSKHKRSEIAKQEPPYILTHDFLIARSLSRGKLCDTLQRALSGVGHADVSLRPYAHDPVYEDAFTSLADRATPQAEPTSPTVALAAEKRLAKQASNRANLSPLRILVAEDNEINRRVILGMLKNLGYEAVVAENGRLAVNAALAETFDLVLMDIHMPELDGLGAMEQIRAHCRDAQCPRIVAMTAHALSGDREHYMESGMDDYIPKPIKMNDLTQALERACKALNPESYSNSANALSAEATLPASQSEALTSETTPVKKLAPKKVTAERDFAILDVEQLEDLRYLPAAPDETVDPNNPMDGLISLFLVKARERLLTVQTALAAHKWHEVAEVAHSLRGSTASMGFLRVAFICKELELSARAREEAEKIDPATPLDFAKFADLLSRLRLNFAEAETALYDWQKQIQAEG